MTAGPEIRPLTPDDAAAFLAVRLRSLREHPEAYHSTAEDWDVPVERAAAKARRCAWQSAPWHAPMVTVV